MIKFVDRYYPSYEQYLPQLYTSSPCAEERTLRYWIDGDRGGLAETAHPAESHCKSRISLL